MPRIYLSPPDITEQDHSHVDAVLTSNWVAPVGPHLDAFEKAVAQHVGVDYALALNSGTAALHLALQLIGVGPGDEVICPSLTFAASANPICYLGAEPVFIDSEPRTWNMDPVLLEQALQSRPNVKAVIVVHLYGQCAEMEPILELCHKYDLPLIEDAAEALGANYRGRPAGSLGDLAFFSFNGNKIVTTSGGGMLLSTRSEWIEQARHLATQAREPAVHYEHKEIGYNYRMSNVLAGLGLSQFEDLDRRIQAKREHFEAYAAAFSDLDGVAMMPLVNPDAVNYWLTCLTIDPNLSKSSAGAVIEKLEANEIESRPLWKPMHLQPVFAGKSFYESGVAAKLFERGVCLPSGSGMSSRARNHVIEVVRQALAS